MPNENMGDRLRQNVLPKLMSPEKAYRLSQDISAQRKQDEGITGNQWIDNFFGGIGSRFAGGIADTATFLGANNVGDFFQSGSDWIEERLKPAMPAEFSWDYISSPEGWARGTGNTLGSMASILAPTFAVPGGVYGTIGRGISSIPKIGRLFSPTTANMTGRWFATGIPEAAMEGGNWYRNAVANGMNPDEAWDKRWGVFGRNAAFLPVSNAAQWGLFSKALKGKNLLAGAGELGSQAFEEGMQEAFTREVSGLPNTWNPISMMTDPQYAEQAQAMKEGFFGFLLPTALGVGAGMYRDNFTDAGRQRRDAERNSDKLYSLGSGDYSATENRYSGESVPSNDLRSIGSGDFSVTENTFDPKFTDRQNQVWQAAQYASQSAKYKYDIAIPPELIYKQWVHEAGANFDSENAVYNNNLGGLTQVEPNGEENKQPDGNNYYSHFDNFKEYADAYVDKFIKYRPELDGVQNERDFATIMQATGYYGNADTPEGRASELANYTAGMERAQVPNARFNGNLRGNADDDKTPIDIQSGLTSARKALDGKQMDNGTVGCVEAVTKILAHVHPEFQKMVDDKVVNTVEGENSLHSRLEKMGVEIVPFDEANVAPGDIIFYDGAQTYQHVLVADHKDADGNWRVFGNSSSANKIMEQPLYQGQTPKWIAKVSNIKGVKSSRTGNVDDTSTEAETSTDTNSIYQRLIADILNEDTKPIFDATGDDETTRSILSAFAADKRDSSVGDDFIKLSSMFDEKGNFDNTKANRKTLADLYGDELSEFGQAALDERLAQLADKNSSVENLTVDDRKLLSGVLKARLEDAGTKVGGHFLKRLNDGDADTFNQALGSLGSVKQTVLPENLSNEIARLRDEIKTLSDKAIQTSDKTEHADIRKQIKSHDAKINSIQTLGKDIAKLEADLQKANDNFVKANATGNATKIATASDKVTKLQTQLDAKQAELTKIISPQVQDATPQTEIQKQAAGFVTNLNADIQSLTAQITPDLTAEQALPLAQQIQNKTAQLNQVKKLTAQIDTLTTKAAAALANLQSPEPQADAATQLADAKKQLQAKEAELAKIITPQVRDATPAPSKKFAPLKAQAEEAVAKFDARIAELRAQDELANDAEIESLTDKRYAIQAAVDETAKLDAKFKPLIQARNKADKAKDATAYNNAKKQLDNLRKDYKSASAKLTNLLTPQETPQAQENFAPVEDFVADELASITQQKAELDAQGLRENASKIVQLNQRRDKIQRDNNEIAKLNAQVAEAENQLSQTTDPKVQETLKSQLANLYSTADSKTKALANFINPPQKSQPETFEPSADFQAKVDEINARMRELRNAGEAKNSADISTLSRQRDTMKSASKKVYHFTAQRDQAELDGNAKEVERLTGEISDQNKKIANAIKRADEVLNPPQKAEKKQAETYPVLPEFQSELDGIKSRMNELRADDEEKNSAEIAKLADRDADIRKANDDIAKWTAARVEKERQRTEAELNGDDKTSTKLSGEIATLNGNIRNARRNIVNNLASTEASEVSQTVTATRFVQEALAPPANGNDKTAQKSRREQGEKLIVLANQIDVQLDADTKKSLERGKKSTIIETQRRLLDSDKLFNRPQQQETQPTSDTNVIEDLKLAHDEISQDKDERKAQGAAIVRVANFTQRVNSPQFQQQFGKALMPKIDLPDGMERDLLNGNDIAIRKAQEIFSDAGLVIRDSSEQETSPAQSDGLRGNTAEVITASRTAHQIRYRVVEANDLTASHKLDDMGVVENKNYPADLQPRDRARVDMQAQAVKMSNNLKPADLMEARDVNQGAPVIRNDGVVLNGNGRTMAIQRAYEIGRGDVYRNALIEHAEQFGLNADAISQLNRPVLVRELTHDLNNAELQDLTKSQTGGAQFGAAERAKADADAISLAAFDELPQKDNVDLTSAEATDFLRAVLMDITKSNPGELNALTDKDGKISSDGINRVKRALCALAYGDDDFIARMAESTDDNVKGATNAFANAAPTVAKVQAAMKKGLLHSYDLKDLIAAVKKLSALRDEGKSVKTYLAGQSIFAEYADTNEMREVLSFLDDNKHAPNKITAFLKKIAQGIQAQGDPRQGVLFGTNEAKPLIDLIRKARNDVENGGMSDLFSPQPEVQPTPKPETQPSPKPEAQPSPKSEPKQQESKPTEAEQREESETTANRSGRSFKITLADAKQEMIESLKELGIKPLEKQETGVKKLVNFIDDSDEALDRALAKLDKAGSKISANAMFDPDLWTAALEVGAIYAQRGINNFADWVNTIISKLKNGEKIRPWLPAIREIINAIPEGSKFNEKQIKSIFQYIGVLKEEGMVSSFEDVQTHFEQEFGKEATAKISPMIEACYKGIQKFFADQQQSTEQTQPETSQRNESAVKDEADRLISEAQDRASKAVSTLLKKFQTETDIKPLKDTTADKPTVEISLYGKAVFEGKETPVLVRIQKSFANAGDAVSFAKYLFKNREQLQDLNFRDAIVRIKDTYYFGVDEDGDMDRNDAKRFIKKAGLENVRYNSAEAPIRDFHTADYPLELGKVFTTAQEQADLANVIKLAEACGGEYVGVSAPFARKGEPDVTKFKFDDTNHADKFMAAYKYFARNVHLTQEGVSPQTKAVTSISKTTSEPVNETESTTQTQAKPETSETKKAAPESNRDFETGEFTNPETGQTSPAKREDTVTAVNEPESTEPTTQGEIVYPDGALTFNQDGRHMSTQCKKSLPASETNLFEKNMSRTVTINGRKMTRLESVEEIAKGNLDEAAMKLNTGERAYLDWLRKNLIEPLKAIQQAGIQNERASKSYDAYYTTPETVYFKNIENDAATLEQLTKLAEAFGGTAQKNKSGNTLFKFPKGADTTSFVRAEYLFTRNAHVASLIPTLFSKPRPKSTVANSLRRTRINLRTFVHKRHLN